MDLDEYRRLSLEGWNTVAPGWDAELDRMWRDSGHVAEWLVDHLDPQPGQTILELACGPGAVGFLAAPRIDPAGRLISTDFSPAMVEVAAKRAHRLGLSNVEARVMNAERMDLESGSVDGVLCRWGYMLMADPRAALTETRRVLRSGGRLSFAVWGAAERNPWSTELTRVLLGRNLMPVPEPGAPGVCAMGDPEIIRDHLAGSGFTPLVMEAVAVTWHYEGFDAYWDWLVTSVMAVRRAVEGMSEAERTDLRTAILRATAPFGSSGGLELPGETYCVLAQ